MSRRQITRGARLTQDDISGAGPEMSARADALGSDGVVALTDTKGRQVFVPAAKLAYVEIGSSTVGSVGFLR